MSAHIRAGLAAGAIGFVLGYLAQLGAGLGALALLGLVALLAGLGTAKWLPREWYGRQLEAGARSGAAACAVAAVGMFLSLAFAGKHDTRALAAQSHLLGLDLAGAIRAFAPIGWLGAALLLSLAGIALGTGLGGLVALAAAWDKNRRAIEVVERAREAAQRANRLTAAGRPTHGPLTPPITGTTLGQSDVGPASIPRSTGAMPRQHDPAGFPPPRRQPAAGNSALHSALAAWAESNANTGAPPPSSSTQPPARPARQPQAQPQPPSTPQNPPDEENWLC